MNIDSRTAHTFFARLAETLTGLTDPTKPVPHDELLWLRSASSLFAETCERAMRLEEASKAAAADCEALLNLTIKRRGQVTDDQLRDEARALMHELNQRRQGSEDSQPKPA